MNWLIAYYAGDIVFGGMSSNMVKHFVLQMQFVSEMSFVRELTYFLSFQVKQMKSLIFLFQIKYVKSIIKKFDLESARHKRTFVATHVKLTKDDQGVTVDQSLYRSMISGILYLTTSHLEITFSIGVCAFYQVNPK